MFLLPCKTWALLKDNGPVQEGRSNKVGVGGEVLQQSCCRRAVVKKLLLEGWWKRYHAGDQLQESCGKRAVAGELLQESCCRKIGQRGPMQESSCRKVGERSLTLEHWCRKNEVRRLVWKGWWRRLEQDYWCRQVQLSLVKLNTFVWLNRNNKTTDLYTCLSGRAFLAQVTDIDYLLLLTSLIQG